MLRVPAWVSGSPDVTRDIPMEDALPTPAGPLVYIHVRAKPTVLVTLFYFIAMTLESSVSYGQ